MCIKHFNPNDVTSSDGQIFVREGAGPDPNRISTLVECKNCTSLGQEVLNLRKEIVEMKKERELKLLQEKEKIRQYTAKLKQITQLANEVATELMVNYLHKFNERRPFSINLRAFQDESDEIADDDIVAEEITPVIEAVDPLTLNNDNAPDDIENTENTTMTSANDFHSNDEIRTDDIKCELVR